MKRRGHFHNLFLVLAVVIAVQILSPFKVEASGPIYKLTFNLNQFQDEQISSIQMKLWKYDKMLHAEDQAEADEILEKIKSAYEDGTLETLLGAADQEPVFDRFNYKNGINLEYGFYVLTGTVTTTDGIAHQFFNAVLLDEDLEIKVKTFDGGGIGGAMLEKVDDEGSILSGVGFRLFFHPDHYLAGGKLIPVPLSSGTGSDYVYNPKANPMDLYTNDKGLIEIKNLPSGPYVFQEVSPKKGYTVVQKDHVFEVKKDIVAVLTVVNKPGGGMHFIKIDGKTSKALQGASFSLKVKDGDGYKTVKDMEGQDIVLKSGEDGRFSISGLPYGTYYLWEIAPPSGYRLLSEPLEFEIGEGTSDLQMTIKNEPSATLPITPEEPPTGTPEKPPKGPPEIPKAGDITIFVMCLVGIVMIAMGRYFIKEDQRARDER